MLAIIIAELAPAAAILFTVLMAGLIVFQAALIAGAPLGHLAWGGQDRVLPVQKRLGSAISIGLYLIFAVLVLQRAGLANVLPWPGVVVVATWVLAGYFALGIVLNAVSRSKPERLTMAPLSAVLMVLTVIVALS
ncbi:hypothetical protein [Cryobacterium arcticum]|uniref:Integral membrane protein n=1 Tax=Cryobacterium arcticum TaxID=670052 RepID=A0A318A1D7_9MICO|nr:hypothetical protein [Cryobacterium arcticum]PXA72102.1 hypothetical protein CTB96_04175 [Cryobacterium arcticum]